MTRKTERFVWMKSNENYSKFSHIYIEKGISENPRTKRILEHFPSANRIYIDHYKDVFNRSRQSVVTQHNSQSLIIAERTGAKIFEGAPVCQSFGNEHFYYTSCIMNCIYDCEYCYLKGMYPSGNMVIFVNLEDYFVELEELLKKHPVYLCISYDADLVACDKLTGYISEWIEFTRSHENLTIEIRTKSGRLDLWEENVTCDRVIVAFTISPEKISTKYEHMAATTADRLEAVKYVVDKGFPVRVCLDPMIYCNNWKEEYGKLCDDIFSEVSGDKLWDVSVGSFRISQDYLKKMRREEPDSLIVNFPYENVGGYYQYPKYLQEEMECFMVEQVSKYISKDKIFRWQVEK